MTNNASRRQFFPLDLTHVPKTFLSTDLQHHMTLQVHHPHLTTDDLT